MNMYNFEKSRQGLLVLQDGSVAPWELKRDLSISSDDIVMDSVRMYNDIRQGVYKAPVTVFAQAAERLSKQGYTVFELPGRNSRKPFGFAVKITEMDSEFD